MRRRAVGTGARGTFGNFRGVAFGPPARRQRGGREMQCSMRQASCSAITCETPSVTKNFVKTQWRSYTCSAIFLSASVKIIWRFSYITSPFSDNLLTALHTDTLETFIAAASLTSRIVLRCSLKRKIVSKYISIDSFFSIFRPCLLNFILYSWLSFSFEQEQS